MNSMKRFTSNYSTLFNSVQHRSFNTAAAAVASAVEIPQFSCIEDITSFAASHVPSMDPITLCKFLRYSHFQSHKLPELREFRQSSVFKDAISQAVEAANTQDENVVGRVMRCVAEIAPPKNLGIPFLWKNAGDVFLSLVVEKKVPISSSNISDILYSLCRLDAQDVQLTNFIREEVPRHIPRMTSSNCRTLMRVFHDMNFRDPELTRIITDQLIESIDQFKNNDVIDSLYTFARIGFVVGPVNKRCQELLTQHTALFDAEELVSAAESLNQLQMFNPRTANPILEEIQKRVRSIRPNELSKLLNILVCAPRPDAQFANEVIGQLASSPAVKTISTETSMAHAICTFNIQGNSLHM